MLHEDSCLLTDDFSAFLPGSLTFGVTTNSRSSCGRFCNAFGYDKLVGFPEKKLANNGRSMILQYHCLASHCSFGWRRFHFAQFDLYAFAVKNEPSPICCQKQSFTSSGSSHWRVQLVCRPMLDHRHRSLHGFVFFVGSF